MIEKPRLIQVDEEQTVTAVHTLPNGSPALKGTLIYAPGAGSNIDDPFGVYLSHRLSESDFATVRFQFPYMEAGKRRPDSPRTLEETWRQVIAAVRNEGTHVIIGGRSMGGRIASQMVAQGTAVDGLVLFAYPLIPPWNRSTRRAEHLSNIKIPTLFCSGTRDTFATPDQLREAGALVPNGAVRIMDGADHGFSVLKSSGRTREDVWNEAVSLFLDWLATLGTSQMTISQTPANLPRPA